MKTRKIFAAALALPMLFACTKVEIVPTEQPAQGDKYDFTINVIPAENETKAFFSDENGIYWDNVDKKGGIINSSSDKYESTEMSHYHYPEGEGVDNQASFKFSATEGQYRFFYPYRSESTFDKIYFEVDTYQTTGVGASSDVFAVISKDLVSLTSSNDLAAETRYQVVGSYIQFLVYGKEGEQVKSIAVKCDENSRISGQYYVDGNYNSLTGVYYNGQDFVLDLLGAHCPTTINKEDAKGLYAAILPSSTNYLTAKNTYVVTTDGGIYTFESGSGKKFAFGSIKTIPLNLNRATKFSKTPEHLYIIGGATQAGWNAGSAIELTKDGNKFKGENIRLTAGEGDSGFKFLTTQGSWSKVYVNGLRDNKTITYYEDPVKAGNDYKFSVDKDGYYDVLVDFDKNEITCTLKQSTPQIYTWPNGNGTEPLITYMSFTEKDDVYKGIVKIYTGDGGHDFKVFWNGKYYHSGDWQSFNLQTAQSNHQLGCSWDVVCTTDANGWWLNEESWDGNRYYEITLDLTNPAEGKAGAVSFKLAQSSNFWLVGYQFGRDGDKWIKNDDYKKSVEGGVVTWDIEIPDGGGFYIAGEYDKEEYFSDVDFGAHWDFNSYTYGGEQNVTYRRDKDYKSWNFTEGGHFVVTFTPASLKIKVEKK